MVDVMATKLGACDIDEDRSELLRHFIYCLELDTVRVELTHLLELD
jgi:hypothetical protein